MRPVVGVGVLLVTMLAGLPAGAQERPSFGEASWTGGVLRLTLDLPADERAARLERAGNLASPDWEPFAVQRPAAGSTQAVMVVGLPAGVERAFLRGSTTTNFLPADRRFRMLYNGYFLTADPRRALSAASTNDRYRLYVLHALLLDPQTGRIAAIWPPFQDDYVGESVTARCVTSYPSLTQYEHPPSPGLDPAALADYWRWHGVSNSLLAGADVVDLQGAVATPGLIDAHFHVTSWAKKVPDEGERFGYFPDISDPSFYSRTNVYGQYTARVALEAIVDAANTHLTNGPGALLHGFTIGWIDDDPVTALARECYLYRLGVPRELNPEFLLNGVGLTNGPVFTPRPSVLVQTTGQTCWYNGGALDRYNELQASLFSNRFAAMPLDAYSPPAAGESLWTFTFASGPSAETNLYDFVPPIDVDLSLPARTGAPPVVIPFTIASVDGTTRTARGTAMLPDVAVRWAVPAATGAALVAFYRPIPPAIASQAWAEASVLAGLVPDHSGVSYGHWDPRNPYRSNWYSGAERGLLQYVYDSTNAEWRATGFAEHYVMRDLLMSVVAEPVSVADNMRFRRNVARWCAAHGLTGAHDIMFYRRRSHAEEFQACEALSYERDPQADPLFFTNRSLSAETRTGRFGLRVGLYYYVEDMAEVDESLGLATNPAAGRDLDRLVPPTNHLEHPGWFDWLGWKLQLDGAVATRNAFSSAPAAKPRLTDAYTNTTETGSNVVFYNHGYGLLTETDEQEQEFTSRETAALYWLVREADLGGPFANTNITRSWTLFKNGVTNWVGRTVLTNALAADLRKLTNVVMTGLNTDGEPAADALAEKLRRAVVQVNDAHSNMLATLARIWYERSVAEAASNPIPHQVVCHCSGDGAVDLYLHAIKTLRNDVAAWPPAYGDLPGYWRTAIPSNAALGLVRQAFSNERYRVEHLVNVSAHMVSLVQSPVDGLDATNPPVARNVALSAQPAIFAIDGQGSRTTTYRSDQELWGIPGPSNFWQGLPAVPRYDHHEPLPLCAAYDIPFTLNTDPPAMRDPRPVLTLIGAVARTPIEIDPDHWLDMDGPLRDRFPRDYLANRVYDPMGIDAGTGRNPMGLTVEQTLSAMTFWGAYSGCREDQLGALASPRSAPPGSPGWLADFVVWTHNPLAIRGPGGLSLEDLATMPMSQQSTQRVLTVDAFIEKFRPALTVVGGMPVYAVPGSEALWQGRLFPGP